MFSHIDAGQIVVGVSGKVYRVTSKLFNSDQYKIRLASYSGKLAYRHDFDQYILSYIEQYNISHPDSPLPLQPIGPDGKPFRWAKWFQSEIASKLYVKKTGPEGDDIKDEVIHEMIFTVMGQRHALDKFRDKIKNFGDVQKLEVARQLTYYLTSAFKFRVNEMQKNINKQIPTIGLEYEERLEDQLSQLNTLKSKLEKAETKEERKSIKQEIISLQKRIDLTKAALENLGEYKDTPRSMSMHQPGNEDDGESNVLDQEQYGTGTENFTSVESKRDIARFRLGFSRWLEGTQEKAKGLILLFDLYWVLVSKSGNNEDSGWMVSRSDLEQAWMYKTGLSRASFNNYFSALAGLLKEYIRLHRKTLGENNSIVMLMDKINQEQRKTLQRASMEKAAKQAGEEDYYDFPKNWKEEETQETHDKKQMLRSIRPGDRVTILIPAGQGMHGQEWKESTGRAVMPSSHGGWVLNMGGKHGTPGIASEKNIVRVRHTKTASRLIPGSELTPEMRQQVQNAFIYRWTTDNPKRTKVYHCDKCDIQEPYVNTQSAEGHPHPTIPLITDDQWIKEHAFSFNNDGKLSTRGAGRHAVPAYLAQEHTASVQQKFALEKAAYNPGVAQYVANGEVFCEHCAPSIENADGPYYNQESDAPEHCSKCGVFLENPLTSEGYRYLNEMIEQHDNEGRGNDEVIEEWKAFYPERNEQIHLSAEEKLPCCGGWHNRHKPGCSVYEKNFNNTVDALKSLPKKKGMLGNVFNDADGQSIRNETLPDTGRIPHAYDTTELKQPRTANLCPACGESPCVCELNCKNGAGSNSGKDDPRGAGDLWRETFYETQQAIDPSVMMNGMKKESQTNTVTMQQQNVTSPQTPGTSQPMAVPEAIAQQAGPHSPNAPMTAPRTPGIQPKIVNVPSGTGSEGIQVQGSGKNAGKDYNREDYDIDPFGVDQMSDQQKEEYLLSHGWVKENEHHGASWWLGKQMWSKTNYEEDIPYQSTEDAIEKELDLQERAADRSKTGKFEEKWANDSSLEPKTSAERIRLKCNECGKKFSVSPNAADPQCPKCGGVDWDVDYTAPKKSAVAPAVAPVNPNVAQNINIQRPEVQQQQPNSMIGIVPNMNEGQMEKKTVEPELPNAKYHMAELVAAEERKLASLMVCSNCDTEYDDESDVCPECGADHDGLDPEYEEE